MSGRPPDETAASGLPGLRWGWILAGPLGLSLLLLVGSQAVFLQHSFYVDLAFGKTSPQASLANYARIVSDPYYLRTLWLTTWISLAVAAVCVVAGFPVARTLSRLQSRWTTWILSAIVVTSFISTVVQIFGLVILFRADGPINQVLMGLGWMVRPFSIVGTPTGVVLGLVYASFGFGVMLLYGVMRAIPASLDEAAALHGASRLRVLSRVVLPLSLPGLIVAFLTIFNTSMGAFTSAALLGGGRIITVPVLIQRTMLLDVKYGMAAALAALLLIFVIALNGLSLWVLRRSRHGRGLAL